MQSLQTLSMISTLSLISDSSFDAKNTGLTFPHQYPHFFLSSKFPGLLIRMHEASTHIRFIDYSGSFTPPPPALFLFLVSLSLSLSCLSPFACFACFAFVGIKGQARMPLRRLAAGQKKLTVRPKNRQRVDVFAGKQIGTLASDVVSHHQSQSAGGRLF